MTQGTVLRFSSMGSYDVQAELSAKSGLVSVIYMSVVWLRRSS